MFQIVFPEKNRAVLLDVPSSAPNAGQVRIRMAYTAISAGTERANLIGDPNVSGARINTDAPFPRSLGYSGSGVIESVGEGVTDLRPGDRVVVYWGKHSQYNTLPRENVVLIPSSKIDLAQASLIFISTFALSAVRKLKIELGESCLVVGAGLLGLFSLRFAAISGALPVIVSDVRADRRDLAMKLGAAAALDPSEASYESRLRELTRGRGVNTVVEVTGNPAAMNQSLRGMAPLGRMALLGCTRSEVSVDFYHDVHFPGITIIGAHTLARPRVESYAGCWTHADDCRAALDYLEAGYLSVSDMINEIHSPTDAPMVYERLASDHDFPIGVLFDWSQLEG